MVVRQLHAVIEILVGPTDVQDVDETGVFARDRLKRGHAFELPQKGALALKRAAINNFHRAQRARHRPGQPNLAIGAAPDHAQEFVVGNDWDLSGNLVGNGRDFTQAATLKQFWGEHAPRVPASAPSRSRTFSDWERFGEAPKRAREARALPRSGCRFYRPIFSNALISFFKTAETRCRAR